MSQGVLDRARAGDEHAFEALTAPHLRELRLHCYRMLGSATDAEDVTQETLLAAWRALREFAGEASVRTWLYRIATNRCLNFIRDRKRRPLLEPVPPFDPPQPSALNQVRWLQPYPDAWLEKTPGPEAAAEGYDTVELAFIAALQGLPPRQIAALLLCDVLGFSVAEAARTLDTTATTVKGLLQRARASLAQRRTTANDNHAPASTNEAQVLASRFARAFVSDDIDALLALLTDEAWLAMPPASHEYRGLAAIASFLYASAAWRNQRRSQLVPTGANRQPAFAHYLEDAETLTGRATGVVVLTVASDRIIRITRFSIRTS